MNDCNLSKANNFFACRKPSQDIINRRHPRLNLFRQSAPRFLEQKYFGVRKIFGQNAPQSRVS
jgi:hypothetical protein